MHYRSDITTDGAPLDVKAQGFWGSTNTKDYFDVKVLIHMPSHAEKGCHHRFCSNRTTQT